MAATRIVQVLDFASARAPELQALHEIAQHAQMQTPADAKLVSQRNQRRRRANAFKSHRMPQRLRQKRTASQHEPEELIALQASSGAATQLAASKSDASTPPSAAASKAAQDDKQRCRKHERRPHKLTAARSWQAVRAAAAASGSPATDAPAAVWMATHVWHSKRMKMVEKFGMVLPAHRADKSVSASLQAVRSTATLHDLSYYGVLELYGLPQLILEALQLVSDPAGSDFHGMRFLAGAEEGQSMLYHEGQFPSGAICPVTFMWRPLATDSRGEATDKANDGTEFELHADWQLTKRQLWLWIHPAAFMEAARAIASACESVVDDDDRDSVIQVLDRRGHLCRFKLRGARADEILASVCAEDSAAATAEVEIETALDADSDHDDGFSASATAQQCARTNLALLRARLNAKTPAATERSHVYSVAVPDPRERSRSSAGRANQSSAALSLLSEPTPSELALVDEIRCPVSLAPLTEQGRAAEEPETALILDNLSAILRWTDGPSADATTYPFASPLEPADAPGHSSDVDMSDASGAGRLVPSSYLWSETKRALVSKTFRKDHELNAAVFQARRVQTLHGSTPLVAATPTLGSSASLSKLHVLALEKREPFPKTSGWDLIVSPSFASMLLKTLVFAGALVVGMEEDDALATVLERPSFPRDYPDTLAGKRYWQAEADARMAEHLRKPKAKRVAYAKHGIVSPFQPNWTQLFASGGGDATSANGGGDEDEDEDGDVCVLRGDEYMQPFCFYAPARTATAGSAATALEKIPVAVPTLVRVVLRAPGRASLTPNAMLLMPTLDDLACFAAQPNWRGRELASSKSHERAVVGFVTSAVYDRPKGAFRATGFCACDLLQDVVLQQHATSHLSTREALVLLRTPHAKMLRPVLLRAQA